LPGVSQEVLVAWRTLQYCRRSITLVRVCAAVR
jgi:hypothetical protein